MPLPLEDYALIGDMQTAALVGRDGSIDWLCLPSFASGACFAALLGNERHGRWLVAPAEKHRKATRRYRDGTLILETEFETASGCVRVVDFMPPRDSLPDLVRIVQGVRGRVPMRTELAIRFDYGWIVPWLRREDGGLHAVAGPDSLWLHSDVPLEARELMHGAEFSVAAGESAAFVLTWHPSESPAPPRRDPRKLLDGTAEYWRRWSERGTHHRPYGKEVHASLRVLKALTFAPSGGIVAAPTTSLPEDIGGVRNWDYRYCWVRDATFTLMALMAGGYLDEARAWRDWLLRAVGAQPTAMQIMYGTRGERRLPELELGWLPGYEGSAPVRIGNAASQQFQLDVYGELFDALHQARTGGLAQSADAWEMQQLLSDFLEDAWHEPDEGIWEVRGGRRHFVHSKVMAWVAFDRMVRTVEEHGHAGPVDRWRAQRAAIHEEVLREGFDADRGTFVQSYGSEALDASLLLIPLVGFLPPRDPRVIGTIAAIQRELTEDGFVLRYRAEHTDDGLAGAEGTFLPCTFWLVDALTLIGRRDEAKRTFERLLRLRNDVGLLSEEYDVSRKRLVGNFPQAFTHVGLVNSAVGLGRRQAEVRR
ncbi:MAG TPA: glycoside hydrolase family 15 protein [Solirubrobacteraceae bacterium]|jgi:GH15 family glucan-1,4-alpha-glucosidase